MLPEPHGEVEQLDHRAAARRLALTGTPFRSDTAPIPFVRYLEDGDGIRRSSADYTYGYGDALKDHVVRPVIFLAYSGQMRWRTSAGRCRPDHVTSMFSRRRSSRSSFSSNSSS